MSDILQNATFVHYLALALLVAYVYVVLWGKKSVKPWLKAAFYAIIVCFFAWAVLLWFHKRQIKNELQEMLQIASYNNGIDSNLAQGILPETIVNDLKTRKSEISKMINSSSISDKIIGRSSEIDTLLSQLNKKIDDQIFRVNNMSLLSKEEFTEFEVAQNDLIFIKPVLNKSYISVGVVIDEEAAFKKENALLVRIIRTDNDSLLYQQSFVPKSGANSFVIPNYFKDDLVQLQIGYVSKTERKTYHYISCTPYERE